MTFDASLETGLGSVETGQWSVETASENPCSSCPTCPLFPPHSNLPVATRDFLIFKQTGATHGSLETNQADILVKTVAAMLSSGLWVVVRSCDGVSISTSNLWLSYLNINATATVGFGSWMILRNTLSGVQYLITINSTFGWLETGRYVSLSAGFTGGTTTVNPTATDQELVNNPVAGDWLGSGPAGNPVFYSIVWVSTDGACTRIVWYAGGKFLGLWQWDQVQFPVSGVWVKWLSYDIDSGNDWSAPPRLLTSGYQIGGSQHVKGPSGVWDAYFPLFGNYGGNLVIDAWPKNLTTNQLNWTTPPPLTVATGTADGTFGYFADLWFLGGAVTPPVAFGDTANGGEVFFCDSIMMPWDNTINPPGIVGSTDHPASAFFGQTSS